MSERKPPCPLEKVAPTLFGLSLLLQVGSAYMVFFGWQGQRPEQMTKLGKIFCCPEREIPLFVLLCLLAVVAVPVFTALFRSKWFSLRIVGVRGDRHSAFVYLTTLAASSFVVFVPMLIMAKSQSFVLFYGHFRGFANVMAAPVMVVVFSLAVSSRMARVRSLYSVAAWAAVPFILIAVVYTPYWHVLSGLGLTQDWIFFHINYFLTNPLLVLEGLQPGDAFYAQYGVGWPLLFARLVPEEALTYARMIGFFMVMGTCYVLLLFRFLRRAGATPAISLFAILLWLASTTAFLAWNYPQRQPVRYFFDILVLSLIAAYLARGGKGRLYGAYALAGACLFFIIDIGLFLLSLLVLMSLLQALASWRKAQPGQAMLILRRVPFALFLSVLTAAALLAIFSPYYPPDIALLRHCASGIIDSVGGMGYGSSALLLAPPAAILCFLAMAFFYLAQFCLGLRVIWSGQSGKRNVLAMLLAVYGLELMLYFVSQSLLTTTLIHFSHPAFILLALQLSWVLQRIRRRGARTRCGLSQRWREAIFAALSVAALAALIVQPKYNGMIVPNHLEPEAFAGSAPPRVIQAFVYREYEDDVRVLNDTFDMAAWYAGVAKKPICMLTPLDTTLYMGISQTPWSMLPYYYYAMKVQARADVLEAVSEQRPQVILLQVANWPENEDTPYLATEDTIEMFRGGLVALGYKVDRSTAAFEFWVPASPQAVAAKTGSR